jgi:hypothetical protein
VKDPFEGRQLRDSCTWKVRSRRGGVTQRAPAVPLSAFGVPFEELSLQASALRSAGPPLMGLLSAMDKSNAENALQSIKELEGRLVSLENRRPPWGFLS